MESHCTQLDVGGTQNETWIPWPHPEIPHKTRGQQRIHPKVPGNVNEVKALEDKLTIIIILSYLSYYFIINKYYLSYYFKWWL